MRIKIALGISVLAASLVGAANSETVDWTTFSVPFISNAHAQAVDWQKVDETLGRKPAVSGDVRRYGFPRTDLTVTLDGVTIKPSLALGGWIAFKPAHGGAMAMGDLVLLETEVTPVVAKLIEGGFEITATRWLALPPFSRSICTSIPITSTMAPRLRTTSTSSWRRSIGLQCKAPTSGC